MFSVEQEGGIIDLVSFRRETDRQTDKKECSDQQTLSFSVTEGDSSLCSYSSIKAF